MTPPHHDPLCAFVLKQRVSDVNNVDEDVRQFSVVSDAIEKERKNERGQTSHSNILNSNRLFSTGCLPSRLPT